MDASSTAWNSASRQLTRLPHDAWMSPHAPESHLTRRYAQAHALATQIHNTLPDHPHLAFFLGIIHSELVSPCLLPCLLVCSPLRARRNACHHPATARLACVGAEANQESHRVLREGVTTQPHHDLPTCQPRTGTLPQCATPPLVKRTSLRVSLNLIVC